jgi:hypothetical protein
MPHIQTCNIKERLINTRINYTLQPIVSIKPPLHTTARTIASPIANPVVYAYTRPNSLYRNVYNAVSNLQSHPPVQATKTQIRFIFPKSRFNSSPKDGPCSTKLVTFAYLKGKKL